MQAIPHALRGFDILGAAKTGSGKTLAFVIPILEGLWREQWSKSDGLGALIISPTRELAYQIFDVMRKVGQLHDFSAALLIGGTEVEFERSRVADCNILICTPGRLLQHLDETPYFVVDSLKYLVLDEADRILDMGFKLQMNALLEHLASADRQTMLFSATQTRSVAALARVTLKSPIYVSVHENSEEATPSNLRQTYMICKHEQKVDVLYSFLVAHNQCKILVFMNSCKQVQFFSASFRKLRCGVPIIALYGGLSQSKRINVYDEFAKSPHIALFATNIAARGLDFPSVDWVVQYDCAMDVDEYIHRVGRTARMDSNGRALLLMTQNQADHYLPALNNSKIPIKEVLVNEDKLLNGTSKLSDTVVRDPAIKMTAQAALKSFLKSLKQDSNKELERLDIDAIARSYGLASTPRIRFLRRALHQSSEQTLEVEADHVFSDVEDDDDFLTLKSKTLANGETMRLDSIVRQTHKSRGTIAKNIIKRGLQVNTRKKFDVDDEELNDADGNVEIEDAGGLDLDKALDLMRQADVEDKAAAKKRRHELKQEKKRKTKQKQKLQNKNKKSRLNDMDVEARLTSDDDDDGVVDDLSWLPEPSDGDEDQADLTKTESIAKKLLNL